MKAPQGMVITSMASSVVRAGFWSFFRRQKVYCSFEDVFYAYRIDPSPVEGFTYFIVMTKIGVGDYGQGIIKDIHFRLTFEPILKEDPEIQIVAIAPTDERREVGTVKVKEQRDSSTGVNVGGDISADIDVGLLKTNLNIEGHIKRKSESEVVKTATYPNEILITRSSGVGNDAVWEFKQGGAAGWKGQYDLNVYFRIGSSVSGIKGGEGQYQVIPTIVINGKNLKKNDKGQVIQRKPLFFFI